MQKASAVTEEIIDSADLTSNFQDSLLDCLVIMTKLKQRPFSHQALRAGLPLENNCFTPELFVRAAARAGLIAKLFKRKLNNISPLILPVVLVLADNRACILTKIKKNHQVEVIFPEIADGVAEIPLKELKQQYSGYVFFIQEEHQFETRASGLEDKPSAQSWFWGTLWKFKHYYLQVVVASIFINLFALAVPLFVKHVYDRVIPNNSTETLFVLATGAIIVFVFDFLMRTLRGFFIDSAGKKVDVIIASRLFEHTLGVKINAKPASTGVQASHLRDFENVRDFFTSASIAGLADLPFVFLFVSVIYLVGGPIALIPLCAIPVVVITSLIISVPLKRTVEKTFAGGAQKHAILVEALTNLDVIKSLSAEGTIQSKWERFVSLSANSSMRSRFYSTLAVNVAVFTQYLVTVLIVIFGVYRIASGDMQVGALIASTILAGRAMAPLGQLTSLLIRYQLTKYSFKALNEVMAMPIERPARHKFLHRPKFRGEIEFEDVSFRYEASPIDLFKNISFHIKAGEHTGIIGPMGSGKSTLLKLIMGFYTPTTGAIRIDGTDIAQIDPADLRRQIGFVQQEPRLFYGTVRENITMKAPWVSDDEVLRVAKISGADNFIGRHPSGYDMPIGEGGQGISGGQCQSICIARSLLLSPRILLFDEPTNSMDNSAENAFMNNLSKVYQQATLMLVTHKMSILALTKRLIVLQHGKVVADGEKDRVLGVLKQLQQKT